MSLLPWLASGGRTSAEKPPQRPKLLNISAIVTVALARARRMVRMNSHMRSFFGPEICSIFERTTHLRALARYVRVDIGLCRAASHGKVVEGLRADLRPRSVRSVCS